MPSTLNLLSAPTDVLLDMARKLGIDPTQFEREALREQIDNKTADMRTVLNFKKTRKANREYNAEYAQEQQTTKLQGLAKENRQEFMKAFGGQK